MKIKLAFVAALIGGLALAIGTATTRSPGEEFRDFDDSPLMVVVPGGSFTMGSPRSGEWYKDEGPQHRVTVGKFAVGKYEVTVSEFARFVTATGHSTGNSCWTYENDDLKERADYGWRDPDFSQGGKGPVVCISWEDAREYVRWLSRETGKNYRLLSESEWEYAARAGTTTPYYTGHTISRTQANYGNDETLPAGSYPANDFGLHDMHGNAWEWVEDCLHDNYSGAPSDGSAWTTRGNCAVRVLRGGSRGNVPWDLRAANRDWGGASHRFSVVGFRVAQTLSSWIFTSLPRGVRGGEAPDRIFLNSIASD